MRDILPTDGVLVTQSVRPRSNDWASLGPGMSDVSVVIVTRDRPKDFEACIRSLETTREDIREVIVVDDASETPPVVTDSTLPIRILRNGIRSFLSVSRNKGARSANGKYVMFIDDDNVLEAGCIKKLSAGLDIN